MATHEGSPTTRRCRLLELPAELRLEIYDYIGLPSTFKFCVKGSSCFIAPEDKLNNTSTIAKINFLATCHTIRDDEAAQSIFDSIKFKCKVLGGTPTVTSPSLGLPDFGAFKYMRTLTVEVKPLCYHDDAEAGIVSVIGILAMIEWSAPALKSLGVVFTDCRTGCSEERFGRLMEVLGRTRFQGKIEVHLLAASTFYHPLRWGT